MEGTGNRDWGGRAMRLHMRRGTRFVLVLAVLIGTLAFGVSASSAQSAFHGIAFVKGCDSPTAVGSPYNCSYSILNIADTAHDSLRVTGLVDVVHAAAGDTSSGNIFGQLQLVFSGAVVCVGGSGAGTSASPYVGATSCVLPFNASITTNSHSFYTVKAGDFALPGHSL